MSLCFTLVGCMPIVSTPISTTKTLNFRLSAVKRKSNVVNASATGFTLLCNDASVVLPENDDEAERTDLERRRVRTSAAFRRQSVTAKPSKATVNLLNESQKKEHYQMCMKLTSENKINTKNAFGLHLIEYIYEMIKKSARVPNFQMASMTLMASARIYGVRVDSLHAKTLKVADSLSIPTKKTRTSEESGDSPDDEGNLADGEDAASVPKSRKSKLRKLKNQIATNTATIDDVLETEVEPHEKYHQLSDIFDDEDVSGVSKSLCVNSDTCKVIMNEAVPYVYQDLKMCDFSKIDIPQDLTNHFLYASVETPLKFALTLSVYSLNEPKWPLDSDKLLPRRSVSNNSHSVNEEIRKLSQQTFVPKETDDFQIDPEVLIEQKSVNLPPESDFDAVDDMHQSMGVDQDNFNVTPDLTKQSRRLTARFTNLMYTVPQASRTEVSVRNITMCLPSTSDEYAVLDPLLEAMILGRKSLRPKLSRCFTKENDDNEKEERSKVPFKFTFEKPEPKVHKERLCRGGNLVLSAPALEEWTTESTTFPVWVYDPKDTSKLFLKSNAVRKPRMSVALDKSIGEYNYNNPVDREFCVDNKTPDDYQDDVGGGGPEHSFNGEDCVERSMVAEPDLVEQDIIPYVKVAKFINQAQVKQALWKIIKTNLYQSSCSGINNGELELPVQEKSVDFSAAYKQLKLALPTDQEEVISVPIAFAVLLHIVNENTLRLKNTHNLMCLTIMGDTDLPHLFS